MFGIVVVAHGDLAQELLAATAHVVGPQPATAAISIGPNEDITAKQAEVRDAVAGVNGGDGVIVVTDMFGGTPSNLAIGCMNEADVEVVYGANLPLLVKLAKQREKPIEEAVDQAIAAGRKYIDGASRMLARKAC